MGSMLPYIYVYMLTKMGYIDGMEHHIWQHHMDPSWDLGHGEFSRKRPWRGGHGDFQAFVMFENFWWFWWDRGRRSVGKFSLYWIEYFDDFDFNHSSKNFHRIGWWDFFYRKPLYLMVKTHGFPVKFSPKPIHWNLAISGTTYLVKHQKLSAWVANNSPRTRKSGDA